MEFVGLANAVCRLKAIHYGHFATHEDHVVAGILLQRTGAGGLQKLRDELEFPAGTVDRDPGTDTNQVAVLRLGAQAAVGAPEHGAADLRLIVLEGEVPVARAGARQVGDFPFDPDEVEVAFEERFHLPVQAGDADGGRWRGEVV